MTPTTPALEFIRSRFERLAGRLFGVSVSTELGTADGVAEIGGLPLARSSPVHDAKPAKPAIANARKIFIPS